MNGIYSNNGEMMRSRGFANLSKYSKEILNVKGNIFKATITKPTTLKEGIIQHRSEDIADFLESERSIDLQSNLNKYELPIDKLTFEYLKDNNLRTEPLTVSEITQSKKYDKNDFNIKLESAYHSVTHVIPVIDTNHSKEFSKLKQGLSPKQKENRHYTRYWSNTKNIENQEKCIGYILNNEYNINDKEIKPLIELIQYVDLLVSNLLHVLH